MAPPIQTSDISSEIVRTIQNLVDENGKKSTLKTYPIRLMVEQAEKFGEELKSQRLETNQIRKFLDAINRLKSKLVGNNKFSEIEVEIVLLKPKLAYAAARQNVVKPLNKVMSAAIDKVESKEDFERLVNLIESIIAYHKQAGGK
ncbi:MAG: type III-A CRISPR-associated protein Csm2 [Coleofasciculaceae cyanobacterium SM2_1_6]|nr:type III-A CRISPR-associated protein Csm2 [Coleofasciculaceae cyanobacterium SM2_1_6]